MNKTKYWLSILAISVILVAGSLAMSPIAIADDPLDEADFTLFTSRTDDFVTCSSDEPFIIHVMATNVGEPGGTTVRVIFTDGDFVVFEVPAGTTVGFSQVAGTGEFDSTIKIDPLDNSGNVNPIVMWVSANGDDDVVCDFESLPLPP